MAETIGWKIDGGFITDLARNWFWDENKSYQKCEELLLSCLQCDQLSEEELKTIAMQIIEGRKKLVGINIFTLEDDNENIRPIYKKIEEQHRQLKIQELKNLMMMYMIKFVDPFSTVKSLSAAKEVCGDRIQSYQQCVDYFWFDYDRQVYNGGDLLIDEYDNTEGGLWLYNFPEIAYEAIEQTDCKPDSYYEYEVETFWRKVYELITSDKYASRFSSHFFKERNERYLAFIRIKTEKANRWQNFTAKTKEDTIQKQNNADSPLKEEIQANITFTDNWLANNVEPSKDEPMAVQTKYSHIRFINNVLRDDTRWSHSESDRMYLILPDDYEEWEGLIAPNGDFYSCSFGGHNAKAHHLIFCYPEKFPNIDFDNLKGGEITSSNALDTLLANGWCATRWLPTNGAYIDIPTNGRFTKAQSDAIWDAKIKHEVSVDLSPIGF